MTPGQLKRLHHAHKIYQRFSDTKRFKDTNLISRVSGTHPFALVLMMRVPLERMHQLLLTHA